MHSAPRRFSRWWPCDRFRISPYAMMNKVVLEEHFATQDPIRDSEHYFGRDAWPIKKAQLLDILDERLRRMDECGIEMSILSLNSPAVQSRTDTAMAIAIAKRAHDQT